MPIGFFKSVREVSSEDPIHVAANLLKENVGMKWKTESVGEKKAHVVLEFEQPQQIVGIDIGNEHAAFIEVLVSKFGCQPDDFKEFLLSCSFMTPVESKSSHNVNRVRCFNSDALNISLMKDKWKLVKIVCTQPFNKHIQYGLSFIKVHVTPAAVSKPLFDTKLIQALKASLHPLKLREESPDSETDGNGASKLFQRWKQNRSEGGMEKVCTAAAIRDAVLPASKVRLSDSRSQPVATAVTNKTLSITSCCPATTSESSITKSSSLTSSSETTQILDRNRSELVFGDDDPEDDESDADAKKERLMKRLAADQQRRSRELEVQQKELEARKNLKAKRSSLLQIKSKESPKMNTSEVEQEIPTTSVAGQKRRSSSASKAESTPKKPKQELVKKTPLKVAQYAPRDQLLNGVVLVISGIQNPDRAELRAKALELGAQYRPFWTVGCTHLICAIRNTPKYKEVKAKGQGKIVSHKWLEKCYDLKKYLPWRRFALDPHDQQCPESDDEIMEDSRVPNPNDDVPSCSKTVLERSLLSSEDTQPQQLVVDDSSDPDTEDELERVAQMKQHVDKAAGAIIICNDENNANNSNRNEKSNGFSMDIYEVDTEEEDYLSKME